MSRTFNVLCPNGRRETIKLSLNSSVLQVLEEACKKQNINPEDFELRHSNKILDLSLPVRFSNLPNNAQVELRPAQNSRKDSLVTVCLQLESGERLTKDFPPSSSIYDVLEQCLRSDSICIQDIGEAVCIYMRQKITGDSIKTTTLRGLGLTKGKAIIRLLYRKPEELEHQAHVSAPLTATTNLTSVKKESQMKNESNNAQQQLKRKSVEIKTEPATHSSGYHSNNANHEARKKDCNAHEIETESVKVEEDNIVDMDVDCNLNKLAKEENTSSVMEHSQKTMRNEKYVDMDIAKKGMSMDCDLETPEDSFEGVGDIKYIGERHAVLYDLNDVTEIKKADLTDEYFDLTIEDAKYMLSEYKRQRDEMESQPLLTKEQRQRKLLQKLAHYNRTVIRIYFPERLVLQAVFEALETVQDVSHFVRNYLEDKDLRFYLYITPPKEKLNPGKTLLEAMLVPAAVIHFGCDMQLSSYLMPNLRDQLSDPRAAALAASESRKTNVSGVPVDIPSQPANVPIVEDKASEEIIPTASTSHAPLNSHDSEKVPKWLKLSRK